MAAVIALNVVLLILFGFLGSYIASRKLEAGWIGFIAFIWWGFCISVFFWACYVVGHFVARFW